MSRKTKAELLEEVNRLQYRIAELETLVQRETPDRNVIGSVDAVSYQLDFESNSYTHLDERIEGLLGYDVSEVSLELWSRICTQAVLCREVGDLSFGEAKRAFRSGEMSVWQADYLTTTKSGRERWLSDSSVPIRDEHGNVSGCLGILQDITERRQAERELRFAQFAIDNIVDAAFWVRSDARFVFVNEAACKSLGYSREELLAKTVHDIDSLHSPENWPQIWAGIKERRSFTFESLHRRKDGTFLPVEITANYLVFDGQEYNCAFARDISTRKQAELELRESEERFRRLAELMPTGMYACDAEGRITYFNQQAATLWGQTPEIGNPDRRFCGSFRLYLPDGSPLPYDETPMAAALKTGRRFHNQEVTIERSDGSRTTVLVNVDPIFDVSGTRTGAITVFFDVTELRWAKEALRRSEERLSLAVRGTSDGLWDWEIETGKEYWSPRFKELLGYREDEIEATFGQFVALLHPEDKADVLEAVRMHLEESQSYDCEFRLRTKSAEYRWFQSRGAALRDKDGRPYRVAGSIRDITDRKRAQNEIRELQEKLAHVARLSTMGEMATGLAHELNQPLAAISAYCYAGQQMVTDMELIDRDRLWDVFEKLTEQSMRSGAIIKRLRGLVSKRTPVRSSVDPGELIRGLLRLMEPDLRESEVRLEQQLDHPMPAVTIDEVQIQQVLVNLIRNALDAMSEMSHDQRTLTITTSQMADDLLEVAVRDTGRGIPVESSDQVFDAFFSSKSEGMGMGLAISRTIIESHGGRLWMTPNSGRGVTFHFTVSLEKDESHDNGN